MDNGLRIIIPLTIYLETPLWNELCDQEVEPGHLLRELGRRGAALIVSTQVISELADTFTSARLADAADRGTKLFGYFLRFTRASIPCLKMNSQILQEEALVACGILRGLDLLLGTDDYSKMIVEVEKLSRGVFDARTRQFLNDRKALMQRTRQEAVEFVLERPRLVDMCSGAAFDEFVTVSHPADRIKLLRSHLAQEFPNSAPHEITDAAVKLLCNPYNRVTHTMILADLYVTWRAARASALARDVQDDCYHLVNASYCDVYATKDEPQTRYAFKIIAPTQVRFYDGFSPLSDWLLALATE